MKISMKKRKIGYTYNSVSGRFPFRGSKTIEFESKLEEDLLTVLEFNDSVFDVTEQPFTIEYTNQRGKKATYTPDFLVDFKIFGSGTRYISHDREVLYPKPLIIEVKPRDVLKKKFVALRPKFKAAMAYAAANDMVFKIFDESRIYGPYYDNVRFLRRYKRYRYDEIEEERLTGMLNVVGHCTIDVLLASLYVTEEQIGIGLGHIYHLLATKKIACDMTLPIRRDTVIWSNTQAG